MTLKLMMSPYARYQSTHVSTPIDIILRLLEFFKTLEQKRLQHKSFFHNFSKVTPAHLTHHPHIHFISR